MLDPHSTSPLGVDGWTRKSHLRNPGTRLSGHQSADWTILGGGFTGLSAARRLAERFPDDRIAVVHGDTIGNGSSCRSSGFVVSLGHFDPSIESANQVLYQMGQRGMNRLRQLVQEHQIDCQWDAGGRLIGARGRPAEQSLNNIESVLKLIGSRFESLDQRQVAEATGMPGYRRAIRQLDSALVNPAALIEGLADSLPANVTLYSQSWATGLKRVSRAGRCGWNVISADGDLESATLLVTTNGYAASLGIACNRVFPMRTYASIATAVGDHDHPATHHLGAARWGITSAERVGSSLRRISSDQILIRCIAHPGLGGRRDTGDRHRVGQRHRQILLGRFPEVRNWKLETTWGGVIGVSANAGQFLGQVEPGLFASVGYNGHGIAQGTASGELLADLASNQPDDKGLSIAIPGPTRVPGEPWRTLGIRAYTGFLNWRFREEL